jgi:hypothetical protein
MPFEGCTVKVVNAIPPEYNAVITYIAATFLHDDSTNSNDSHSASAGHTQATTVTSKDRCCIQYDLSVTVEYTGGTQVPTITNTVPDPSRYCFDRPSHDLVANLTYKDEKGKPKIDLQVVPAHRVKSTEELKRKECTYRVSTADGGGMRRLFGS